MTPTRWQRVQDLVNAAVDLPANERAAFLANACGSNSALQHQIEELLQSYEQADSFLEDAVEANAHAALRSADPAEGERIGAYQLTGVVGRGGMGTVYSARRVDDQFRQNVAIKVLSTGLGITPELLTRFRAERQILASLTHVNIARLLDGGITPSGLPYLVMEYIEGTTLDRFAENRALNIRGRLEVFRQICAALEYAHKNLIVHRDIKPANVIVTEEGTPKLLDFGIAKLLSPDRVSDTLALTRPAERLMTPEYASPEQIRGEAITTATDVYGLGVLLYELLTNRRPFRTAALSLAAIERLICETSPERPSVAGTAASAEKIPVDLDNIVFKAMHKDPACRYGSAAALSDDVRRYLEGFPILARPDSWRYRARKFVARNKLATAAGALFSITTIALSAGLAWQAARAKQEAQVAARQAQAAEQVSNFLGSLFESPRPDQTQGRSTSARDILDHGASRVSRELGGQPVVEARLLNILGRTYYELGALDQAQALLTRAYEIRRRVFGPDSEEAADPLKTLAQIASDKGEFERAKTALDKALSVYTAVKGQNSAEVAELIYDLAELRRVLGDFKGAKPLYLEAIAISTQIKGPDDWLTVKAKLDLEIVLADLTDYVAAESLAREDVATELRVWGPDNPYMARSLSHLAYVLGETSQFEEAQATYRQSLEIRRKANGSEHPAIALLLSNLGGLARELGHYDKARELGEQSLAMAIKLVGPRSLGTAECQSQLGLTMLTRSDLKRARELVEASLATRLAVSRPDNPDLGRNYDEVGLVDLAANQVAAARWNIEQGLKVRELYFGRENDKVASSLNHLGRVLAAERDYRGAESNFREAIRIAGRKFKGPHAIAAEGLLGLGTTLLAQGRGAEGRAALLDSLEVTRKLRPAEHPDVPRLLALVAKSKI